MRPGAARRVAGALARVAALALLAAAPAAAQTPVADVDVAVRPRGTLVGITLVLPVGSAADPEDSPGTARLLGEAVAATAVRGLDEATVNVGVEVDRSWTAWTVLTTPAAWSTAWRSLADAVFSADPAPAAVEERRADLLDRFAFERGAPVREFEHELYDVVAGVSSPWGRPPRGRAEVVERLTPDDLASFRDRHYRRDETRVAVVGPLDAREVRAAVQGVAPRIGSSRPGTGPLYPAGADDPAWLTGTRVVLDREVTNTSLGVAFPAPADVSRTALELLTHRLQEVLNPSPPDPGLFGAEVFVEDAPRGPVVVVEAAVFPEAAAAWERAILDAVTELAGRVEPAFWRWELRRFRSTRLAAEAAPEAEARRRALDLLRSGRARDLPREIDGLTAEDLARTVRTLGEPRIVVFGPDVSDGSSG